MVIERNYRGSYPSRLAFSVEEVERSWAFSTNGAEKDFI
jgi:hypothetical protein